MRYDPAAVDARGAEPESAQPMNGTRAQMPPVCVASYRRIVMQMVAAMVDGAAAQEILR